MLEKFGQFLIVTKSKPGWTNLPARNGLIVQKHTGQPVLLLLDNAPGHFESFEKDGIRVEFFPPNCTSWKQPCDQGIINAFKIRYKFLYLKDVLHFYDLPKNEKEILQIQSKYLRRGSAGVQYGNPAHLMDVAKYVKEAWDSVLPISIENCFRKADISIQYYDDITVESFEEMSIEEQMVELIAGISDISVNDITEFIHVDDQTSAEFTEAIIDDVNDLIDAIDENHYSGEDLEDEEEKQDDIINFSDNSANEIRNFEQVFDKIAALGTEILHPSLLSKSYGHHSDLMAAYENLLSIGMRIHHAEIQENALKPRIQLGIKDFFK